MSHFSGYKIFLTNQEFTIFLDSIYFGFDEPDKHYNQTASHYRGYNLFDINSSNVLGIKNRYDNG